MSCGISYHVCLVCDSLWSVRKDLARRTLEEFIVSSQLEQSSGIMFIYIYAC